MKYYLYKITNPNNHIYIGQTKHLKSRLSHYKHANCVSQRILYNSILKHGWENHKFEIIKELDCSQEEIDQLEIYYISIYKKDISMNITKGGTTGQNGGIKPKGKDHYK